MPKIKTLIEARGYIRNWYVLPLLHYGLRKRGVIRFRCGLEKSFGCDELGEVISLGRFLSDGGEAESLGGGTVLKKDGFSVFVGSDWTGMAAALEMLVERPYAPLATKGKVVLDIGAHIGDSTVIFARDAKRVIAYEPIPYLFGILKKNVELNRLKNVTAVNKGVGKASGAAVIRIPGNHWGAASVDMSHALAHKGKRGKIISVPVEMECIADILKKYRPQVIKMDCEGAEYDILEGLPEDHGLEEIILEVHYLSDKGGRARAIALLNEKGFKRISMLQERKEKTMCLIHAKK